MIGIPEIIVSILVFIVIWFLIFKMVNFIKERNLKKNISEKLEKQNKKYFVEGKEIDIKKELGLNKKVDFIKALDESIKEVEKKEVKKENKIDQEIKRRMKQRK